MALQKGVSPKADHVSVTFRIPAGVANSADLVGEFTDWGLVSMQRNDDGSHSATFDLGVGRVYRFRYLLDGSRWENDWAADAYQPNDYGGDDSVVDVRRSGPSLDKRKTTTADAPFPIVEMPETDRADRTRTSR